MLLANVPRIFKIAGRASVIESLFSEVTGEIFAFYNYAENPIRKVALLKTSRNYLLAGVARLQPKCCKAA